MGSEHSVVVLDGNEENHRTHWTYSHYAAKHSTEFNVFRLTYPLEAERIDCLYVI